MLKTRVITAAVLLPLLLALMFYGPQWAMALTLVIFVGLAIYEFSGMLLPALEEKLVDPNHVVSDRVSESRWIAFCVAAGLSLFMLAAFVPGSEGRAGMAVGLAVLIIISMFSSSSIDRSMGRFMGFLVSVCYGSLPFLSIWDLYRMADHRGYLMVLCAVVFLNDTGGYFGGRRFGHRKLAPTISPKKTWEGAFFGLLAAIVGAFAMNLVYGSSLGPWWLMIIAAVAGGMAGIFGDLSVSIFKRFAGIKDSGSIFPGHGGFLDRADAFLLASPVVWFVFYTYQTLRMS